MTTRHAESHDSGLLASLLTNDAFHPAEPQSLEETGVSPLLIETLICKYVKQVGSASGHDIAERLCLPFGILEDVLLSLRLSKVLVHKGPAESNDDRYALTEQGLSRAQAAMQACSYVGPAPVPLDDYVMSVEAQSIRAEAARVVQLTAAFRGIHVEPDLLDLLGPAVNSGAAMLLYGPPGNGKTTIAKRIAHCFSQPIWIPRTFCEDGQIIKLYDAACHEAIEISEDSVSKPGQVDNRWVKIRRPAVAVGGELGLDNLEIRHDPMSNVSEAPLQLKSNCGCLLVDDFGRQRIDPHELLNRWIVPLESRIDFLTLATSKRIQVPFEQLIIFSTNLEPLDLADEVFLRRIPYKIEVKDPSLAEFSKLFELACQSYGCRFYPEAVHYLIQTHYMPYQRPLRRCHPRDLLAQIKNYCTYHGRPMELRPDYLDRVAKCYFTTISDPTRPEPMAAKSSGSSVNVAAISPAPPRAVGLPPRTAVPNPPRRSRPN